MFSNISAKKSAANAALSLFAEGVCLDDQS